VATGGRAASGRDVTKRNEKSAEVARQLDAIQAGDGLDGLAG